MFVQFVLPDLASEHPYLRATACQAYGMFEDLVFEHASHLKQVVERVYENMAEGQPLPVKFAAARTLEAIL